MLHPVAGICVVRSLLLNSQSINITICACLTHGLSCPSTDIDSDSDDPSKDVSRPGTALSAALGAYADSSEDESGSNAVLTENTGGGRIAGDGTIMVDEGTVESSEDTNKSRDAPTVVKMNLLPPSPSLSPNASVQVRLAQCSLNIIASD